MLDIDIEMILGQTRLCKQGFLTIQRKRVLIFTEDNVGKQTFSGEAFGDDALWSRLLVNTSRLCFLFALTTSVFRADNLQHF